MVGWLLFYYLIIFVIIFRDYSRDSPPGFPTSVAGGEYRAFGASGTHQARSTRRCGPSVARPVPGPVIPASVPPRLCCSGSSSSASSRSSLANRLIDTLSQGLESRGQFTCTCRSTRATRQILDNVGPGHNAPSPDAAIATVFALLLSSYSDSTNLPRHSAD
jgi:hypothetical protein